MRTMNIKQSIKRFGMRGVLAASMFAMTVLFVPEALAKEIFADLAGDAQVDITYVSGKFAHNQKTWRSQTGRHAMDLSKGFSSLYSYQCYSEQSVKKARRILEAYLKANPTMEIVMKQSQGMQEYVVYEKFMADDRLEQMIIWNSDAPNVCEIVVIDWENGFDRKTGPTSRVGSGDAGVFMYDDENAMFLFSEGYRLTTPLDYIVIE